MKTKLFFAPPALAALFFTLSLAMLSLFACRQEHTDQATPNVPQDDAVGFRATCTDPNYCNLQVTALEDAFLTLCGDLPDIPGDLDPCDTGCNSSATDQELEGTFPANVTREHCIDKPGSVCITNNEPDTVTVRVKIGSGSTLVADIPPGEKHCFHGNSDCDETNDGCL